MEGSRPHSHCDAIIGKQFENVSYACTFLPTAKLTGTTGPTTAAITTATETITNNATATTVLHKWNPKLWQRRFR